MKNELVKLIRCLHPSAGPKLTKEGWEGIALWRVLVLQAEDQSSIPRTHIKMPGNSGTCLYPSTQGGRVSLVYRASPRTARTTQRNPLSDKQTNKKKKTHSWWHTHVILTWDRWTGGPQGSLASQSRLMVSPRPMRDHVSKEVDDHVSKRVDGVLEDDT